MATRIAQANTANNNVWSSTLTWQGGIVPLPGDDVAANGITVNVDGIYTVNSLRNDTSLGGVAGGTFNLLNGSKITTTASSGLFVQPFQASPVVNFNLPFPQTAAYQGNNIHSTRGLAGSFGVRLIQVSNTGVFNITGNFHADALNAVTNESRSCIFVNGAARLNIVGDLTSSVASVNGVQSNLYVIAGAIINITSSIISGGNVSTALNSAATILMQAIANLTITSTIINGGVGAAISMNAGGTCVINATSVTGGGGSVAAISNITLGAAIDITGLVNASASANAVNSLSSVSVEGAVSTPALGAASAIITTGSVTINGNVTNNGNGGGIICSGNATVTGNVITNGNSTALNCGGLATINGLIFNNQQFQGVYAPRILIGALTTAMRYQTFAGTTQLMFSSSSITLGLPTPNNVRLNTNYGNVPQLTGTCVIPNPNTVVLGAPTDNTVGTLVMSPAAVIQELNTSTVDVAVRLRNVSTVETMGEQAATYGI